MTDTVDIFGRPIGNRPAHMNTFLRLDEPKTKEQIAKESGYTNVEGHVNKLVSEGKVISAGRGNGYVINKEWFNRKSEAARQQFLASCGLNTDSNAVGHRSPAAKTRCWCVNFDDERCLKYGMTNNLWMMQYQYAHPAGPEFQGGSQKSTTTRMWRRLGEINSGDKLVAYLKGNRFFAVGTVIAPRRTKTTKDAVDTVEAYVKRKQSHDRSAGFVYYTPVFYENFDDKWRHPIHRSMRYSQRIDVDHWEHHVADGVSVTGLGVIAPNEIQMAVFEIEKDLFDAIEAELATNDGAPSNFAAPDGSAAEELTQIAAQVAETDYFSPASLKDERERRLKEIVERRGQPEFRKKLIAAYNGSCVATGYTAVAALEAAHIVPYSGPASDHVTNGLLLRADVHTLFDLDLIGIHPDTLTISLAPALTTAGYAELQGRRLVPPVTAANAPNREALQHRWELFCSGNKGTV